MPFPALLIWGAIGAATAYGAKKVIDAVTDSDSDSDSYTTTSGPSKEEVKEDNRKRILSDIKKSVNDFVRNNEKLVVFKSEESTDQDEISESFSELFNDITDGLDELFNDINDDLEKKPSLDNNKQTNKKEQIVFVDNQEFKLKKSVSKVLIENIDKCDNLDSFIQLINANNKDYHIAIKENSPAFEFYTKANSLSKEIEKLSANDFPYQPQNIVVKKILKDKFFENLVCDINEANVIAKSNQSKEPRVVVCGLLKAGKSSLLNSLFKNTNDDLFAVGRTRKTAKNQIENNNGISFIDTPGTDANEQDTQEAYDAYIASDLLLFVHSGERELVSQEIEMLKKIPISKEELEAKLEIVVTNSDLSFEHINELKASISRQIQENFGFTKELHFVSNKLYKTEKLRSHSGIDELRSFIYSKVEANKAKLSEKREQALLNAINKIKADSRKLLQKQFIELNNACDLPIDDYSELTPEVINQDLYDDYEDLHLNLVDLARTYISLNI